MRNRGAVVELPYLLGVAEEIGTLFIEKVDERLAKLKMVPGVDRQIEYLDIEVPPDARPAGRTEPRSEEIDRHAVGTRGTGQFVELDPVEALQLGIGDGYEALRIECMPPHSVGIQQRGEVGGNVLLHRGDRFRGGGVAGKRIGDAEHDASAFVGWHFFPSGGEGTTRETRLLADRDAVTGFRTGCGIRLIHRIAVYAVSRGSCLPCKLRPLLVSRRFDVGEERHLLGVDETAEGDTSLIGSDLASHFGVPEIKPQRAVPNCAHRRQHQTADGKAGVVAAMLGNVGASHLPSETVSAIAVDRGAHQAVAEEGTVVESFRQRFPYRILTREEAWPVDAHINRSHCHRLAKCRRTTHREQSEDEKPPRAKRRRHNLRCSYSH